MIGKSSRAGKLILLRSTTMSPRSFGLSPHDSKAITLPAPENMNCNDNYSTNTNKQNITYVVRL